MSRSSVRCRSFCADLARDLGTDQRVGQHGAPGQQAVVLEHEAAVAAGPVERAAVEQDRAGARRLEARDDAQERGLAAAARPDDRDEFAASRPQGRCLQHLELAEPLVQMPGRFRACAAMASPSSTARARFSTQPKPAVMAMPATASTITPANSSGMLKASADWLISRPRPAREPNSSATTTPIRPRPMPSLRPARMNGSADGSDTLKKICRSARAEASQHFDQALAGGAQARPRC